MNEDPSPPPPPSNRLGLALLGVLIAGAAFQFPKLPGLDLDPSWRMGLSWFFQEKLQFGRDVIFTYGPLGFLMGRTYSGIHFWSLIGWQLAQAGLAAVLFLAEGRRLGPVSRFFFFAFVVLLGVIYEDALHMLLAALLGVRLLRAIDVPEPPSPASLWLAPLLLAFLSLVKFTNFLIAGVSVACAVGLALAQRRPRVALGAAGWFALSFGAGWLACGQSPLNFPRYLRLSLEISSGYNDSMGLPTPDLPFALGLVVAALLAAYFAHYLWSHPRKPAALAHAALIGAFVFLAWKHGFVRADGHMIGFFFCALLPIVGFPVLMGDAPDRRWLGRVLLVPAGLVALVGTDAALPIVRGATGHFQEHLWSVGRNLLNWTTYRAELEASLKAKRQAGDLPRVRDAVAATSVDVLGYEQGYALLNGLNYRPRPVIQSYSAYTPALAGLNLKYYASSRAPEYALLKIDSLDGRLAAFDDAPLLNYFLHAYDYVLREKEFQLWRRRADAPPAPSVAPQRLRTATMTPGVPLDLADLAATPLWMTVDLRPSLLGRLRGFLYKPAPVHLKIEDSAGLAATYRMPTGEGRTGFIINPIIHKLEDYLAFSGNGAPQRRVRRVTLDIAPSDRPYFRAEAAAGLFTIPQPDAGVRMLAAMEAEQFWMFKVRPDRFSAFVKPAEVKIDDRPAVVMHAPSEMEFAVPAGAKSVTGRFGYPKGAYDDGGRTNGAGFTILWTDGRTEAVLFHRYLDPRGTPTDRGLQPFEVGLGDRSGGRLRFVTDIGHNGDTGWDWTAWTEIAIR